MRNTMQYIVDGSGERTSVIVPYKKWEKINEDYIKLQNKLKVFSAIQDGIEEIRTARKRGQK